MRCPYCVAEKRRSRLDERRLLPSYHPVERFYDEDGDLHVHDRSTYAVAYSCSGGHSTIKQWQSPCPHKGCAWNERPEVKAADGGFGATNGKTDSSGPAQATGE